jgi:hypothetical protein
MQHFGCNSAYRDVDLYLAGLLKQLDRGIQVSATYRKEWHDGFGARGWKLNAMLADPAIIASTRQTGERINTSVFVHDILDHFISGFGVSGHRSEAMALMQLSKRTGSDPRADFRQMVMEDIINGRVSGESLHSFLPDRLLSLLPPDKVLTDRQVLSHLMNALGYDMLVEVLVDHFVILGQAGEKHALNSWKKLGLDPAKTSAVGVALQKLLMKVDREAESSGVDRLGVSIVISNEACAFIIETGNVQLSARAFHKRLA